MLSKAIFSGLQVLRTCACLSFWNVSHDCLIRHCQIRSFVGSVVLLICLVPTVLCIQVKQPFTFGISVEWHLLKISMFPTFYTFTFEMLLVPAVSTGSWYCHLYCFTDLCCAQSRLFFVCFFKLEYWSRYGF